MDSDKGMTCGADVDVDLAELVAEEEDRIVEDKEEEDKVESAGVEEVTGVVVVLGGDLLGGLAESGAMALEEFGEAFPGLGVVVLEPGVFERDLSSEIELRLVALAAVDTPLTFMD